MVGPTKLTFDNTTPQKKDSANITGPGTLVFKDTPPRVPSNKVTKQKEDLKLKFDESRARTERQSSTTEVKTLFGADKAPNEITKAMQYVEANFAALKNEFPSIERQIKQLIPLKLEAVIVWGASALNQESQLALKIVDCIKEVSQFRCNELCEKLLNIIKGTNDHKLLTKFLSGNNKADDIRQTKAALVATREQIKLLYPNIDQYITESEKSETRLLVQLSALAAACESNTISDSTLEHSATDRRTILQQAATQAKLANLQLIETKKNILSQLSRVEQLLNVTLPAYEMALVNKS